MRITILALFISVFVSQATSSFSQETKLTLNLHAVTIKEVCKEIERNSDYIFVFADNIEDAVNKNVTVTCNSENIETVLNTVFLNTQLFYEIIEKQIVVYKDINKNRLGDNNNSLDTFVAQQKRITVKGKIADENGQTIIGANVVEKNRLTNGVSSDINGNFTILVPSDAILVISYIGYIRQEVKIDGKTQLNITLKEDAQAIEEVVVTGYQVMDKRETASSVFSVKASDIMVDNSLSIDQMLQGEIPGMAVISTSGEPSATPKIRIRGNATINGNKSPVWVVDGVIVEPAVPFTASELNSEDAEYLIGNAISGLNPRDIETITVLKDASATAIYGVKAANGVIVITTKKGKEGKATISYSGNVSMNQRPSYRNFDRMNSRERMILSKEIVELGYRYPRIPSGDSYEGALQELYRKQITQEMFNDKIRKLQQRNTDWYKEIFRSSVTNTHNLNISGGTPKTGYYFSIGYNQNFGGAQKSKSERLTSLAKINMHIGKNIDLQIKTDFSTSTNRGYHSTINPHRYAYKTSRTLAPYNEDGSYALYDRGDGRMYNFFKELELTGQSGQINDFNGLIDLNIKIAKGLSYQGVFSLHNSVSSKKDWAEEQSYYIARIRGYEYHQHDETSKEYEKSELPFGGILSQSNIRRTGYTIRNIANYKRMFNAYHDIHAMGGIELRSNHYRGVSNTGYGWVPEFGEKFMPVYTNSFVDKYVRQGRLNPINTNNITQVASYFGTFTYSYKYKYILNTNIRSDGSNKFGSNPKYRWLPTWSVAGKWRLSEEPFVKNINWIDDFAIRASYGIQGNIHDDSSPELIVRIQEKDGISGLDRTSIYRLPNPDLRWEKTNLLNVAADFSLFKKRLKGSFEIYKKHTSDLIHSKRVASSNGQSVLVINSGEMENYGYEGFLSADILRGKLFDWRMSINFAQNINNVILANKGIYSKKEEVNMMLLGETAIEGEPIGSMYSYRFAGLSSENGYPLFYTKDGRKVHIGEPELLELVNCGSIFPKISGGFDTQITYKKSLSLGLGFTYNIGGTKRLPNVYEDINNVFDPLTNVSKDISKRWKKPGDEKQTSIPAIYDKDIIGTFINDPELHAMQSGSMDYLYPTQIYNMSDERIAKANFLRLRLVSLSYILPTEIISKLEISSCALRLQATNLHVWKSAKWKGLDPETPQASIPVLPTYSLGVNIAF